MSAQVVSTIIDDRDPSIQYQPSEAAWTVRSQISAQSQFYGNTDTSSNSLGASIQYTFQGDAIEYWGSQGPTHGPCQVNIDGTDRESVNSYAAQDAVPTILSKIENLQNGAHTIKITVSSGTPPNVCQLDRFIVMNRTITGGSSTSTVTVTPTLTKTPTPSPTTTSVTPWPIIGGAVGGGVLLILGIFGLWLWLGKRTPQRRRRSVRSVRSARSARTFRGTPSRTSIGRDSEKAAAPPLGAANNVEKSPFGYGVGGGGVHNMHGQHGQPGFTTPPPPSPPQPFSSFQPFGAPAVHPMNSGVSVQSGPVYSPAHSPEPSQTSTYFSGHPRPFSQTSGFDYYTDQQHQPPQQHPQQYPPQHPQQYPQQYPQQLHPQHPPQHPPHPQYEYQAQPAAQPVWVSGETLPDTAHAPVIASEPPAHVQRAASLTTSAPDVRTSAEVPQEKAVYSRAVQPEPEATPGAGGSRAPGANVVGEDSGTGAVLETPDEPEAPPPAYDASAFSS